MRNKRFRPITCSILFLTMLLFFSTAAVRADELGFVYRNPQTGYSVYIDDEMDLLTEYEETILIEDMKPITEFGNVGFVSCENQSYSTSQYSARKYSEVFGSESGTLLVIDMGMREFYIKNDGEVSRIITDAYSHTISDNVYKYASSGDYYRFASVCFSQIYTVLSGGKIAQPMRFISAALLALILGLLINYLIMRFATSPDKADTEEIIDAAKVDFRLRNPSAHLDHTTKVYDPVSHSSGGGGSRGGGGFSGGGSGGGHRF